MLIKVHPTSAPRFPLGCACARHVRRGRSLRHAPHVLTFTTVTIIALPSQIFAPTPSWSTLADASKCSILKVYIRRILLRFWEFKIEYLRSKKNHSSLQNLIRKSKFKFNLKYWEAGSFRLNLFRTQNDLQKAVQNVLS